MSQRKLKLVFDNEIMNNSVDIAGVPQGSPVSSILFLIYINQLFKQNHSQSVRLASFADDIGLITSSKTIRDNCSKLEIMATKLIDWGDLHDIQFDMSKTELIHFDYSNKSLNCSVKIKKNKIKLQETVRWLDI